MTVAVKTMTGRVWHLAAGRKVDRTFCGLRFAEDLDDVRDLAREQNICTSCAMVRYRRLQRGVL